MLNKIARAGTRQGVGIPFRRVFSLVSDVIAQIEGWGRMMEVDELAELTSVSPKTIYRMIQRRKLPALRIGGSIRLNPKEVAEWLRSRQF